MTNSNPFTIRLELLKMAKDLLMEEYYTKKEILLELGKSERADLQLSLEYPKFPNELDILAKATILNEFISKTK
ncbi:MAG: hypothetical protein ACK5GV_08555 [Bacteroidota bacterium]|jgi:hypothetical protein